jgi:hypothetical protein
MMTTRLLQFLIYSLLVFSNQIYAQSLVSERQPVDKDCEKDNHDYIPQSAVESSEYPGGFFDTLRESYYSSIYGGADALAVSLFESISNIDIFSQSAGPGNIAVNIQRRIFNNHDINQSWTVMDIMRVPYSVPLIPSTNVPVGPLSVSVGATGQLSLSMVHIRQVMPDLFNQLNDLQTTKQQMDTAIEDNKLLLTSEAPVKKTFWQKIASFFKGDFRNARTRAQFNRLYNVLTQPLQFPFTEKGLLKMPVNDIRIYAFEGLLQLSAGVGFSISAVPGVDLFNMGVGPSVYVGGRWQVAILKLPNNKLKVKITRITDNGRVFSFGAQHRWDIFKGFVVFGEHIGAISQTLIPFQFSVSKEHSDKFDIGYEFDLSKPEALDAAQKMIGGHVRLTQQMARKPDSGVVWNFRRDQKTSTSTVAKGVHLDFLFYHQRITKTQKIDAILTLPDGEHHFFKGISDSVMAWDSVFGGREKKSYSFQTLTDQDALAKGDDKAMILRMSGTIEDARTTGKEMRRYINEVETALGDEKLFDNFPTHLQKKVCVLKICKQVTRLAKYGSSSFLYRITMRKNQVDAFINADEARVWHALERGYGIKAGVWSTSGARRKWALVHAPLTLLNLPLALIQSNIRSGDKLISASRFFHKWQKLREQASNPKGLT